MDCKDGVVLFKDFPQKYSVEPELLKMKNIVYSGKLRTMEKLLDSLSGFVDSKLRNPFINTFLIAWIAFNWKPILYFIFAKVSAGKKIWVISEHYSDIWNVVLYPVGWTILVLISIPAILAATEYLLKFITKIRLNIKGEIAVKENEVEDQVLNARKVGDVNKYIAELKEKVEISEKELGEERTKNLQLAKNHNDRDAILNKENLRLGRQFTEEVKKNAELQQKMDETIETFKINEQFLNRKLEDIDYTYRNQLNSAYEEIQSTKLLLQDSDITILEQNEKMHEKQFIIDKIKDEATRLYFIDGKTRILETVHNGKRVFYDIEKNEFWDIYKNTKEYLKLLEQAQETFDQELINEVLDYLRVQFRQN